MRKTVHTSLSAPFGLLCTAAAIYGICLCACGSSSDSVGNAVDPNAPVYALTVTNQYAWCNVTITIDGNQLAVFSDASATVSAPAKTTVNLNATPQPSFNAAVWTGTTSTTSPTTYVMTSDPNQTVNVYCQ